MARIARGGASFLGLAAVLSFTLRPALASDGPDMRTRSCEVRPQCAMLVPPTTRCEKILDWTGSCSGGFAEGVGAAHFLDATATYGRYRNGRLTGSFIWHRNGLLSSPGEYPTQLVTLDKNGYAAGVPQSCAWDEEGDRLFKRDPHERACGEFAAVLGENAFSPQIWKIFARRMTAQLTASALPAANPKAVLVLHRHGRAKVAPGDGGRRPRRIEPAEDHQLAAPKNSAMIE